MEENVLSSGILLQSSLRKWKFLNQSVRLLAILVSASLWECSQVQGAEDLIRVALKPESLSMDMDGLYSKLGCSVVLLGETLWEVYS